jgi:predicted MFS family arabinose efflux permease
MKQPLWTKDFILFIGSNFFVSLNFYILVTTMALYSIEQFQASESQAGLASSIFIVGALIARIFAGALIEKVGRKKMLYFGLLLFLVATFFYFFSSTLAILLIVRFVHGLAFGLSATGMNTTVMDSLPIERRGEGTGYFSLSSTAATAFGPFIGILLLNQYDMNTIFICAFVMTIIAFILAFIAKVKEADLTTEERKAIPVSFKFNHLFSVEVLPIAGLTLLMGVCYASLMSFINIYAIEVNLITAGTYFFLVYGAFLFVSRPVAGKILDAKGDNVVIFPAIFMFSVSLVLLSIAETTFIFLLAAVFAALGFGTYLSCAQVVAAKVAPRNKIGLAVSTFYIGLDTGVGIGPIVLGLMLPYTGYQNMYLYLALLVFCLLFVYYVIHGRKPIAKK